MSADTERLFCLRDELDTSHKLIRSGFGSLQEVDMANDFYHLPQLLLSSGLERFMKCYVALVHQGRAGSFPVFMKDLGHDLDKLLETICRDYYGATRPLAKRELDFLTADPVLRKSVRILSLFGKRGRYYNLDVVAGNASYDPIDPKNAWEALERSIEDPAPFVSDMEALYRDYYPRVHQRLIAKLERLVRGIALQFTIGDHRDPFGRLQQSSPVFSDFRNLKDDDLGTTDYRQSARILRQKQSNWLKRSEDEISNGRWPTRTVTRDEFGDQWPFRAERVVIELQERLFAIVNIEGYAFALNGAAASRFKLPNPHDAGVAVLGKSVGPLIAVAQSLQ